MTSKNLSMQEEIKSCYIFLDTGDTPQVVAQYALKDSIYNFIYGKSYLDLNNSFELDPINLPFITPNTAYTTAAKDGFGVLADATPDNWGHKLTLTQHTRVPLNQIEWLIAARGNAVGCLVASLSSKAVKTVGKESFVKFSDLQAYLKLSKAVDQHQDPNMISMMTDNYLSKLIHHGSSMGGARPKVVVQHKGIEWIAKFNKSDDLFDNAKVEYASMKMAQALGLNVSNVELEEVEGNPILLVERFDRNCPERKKHYISAHSLMNIRKVRVDDLKMSYMHLSKICSQICHDAISNQLELYKRMVLNVMISNTDDHLKNHGFLMHDMKNHHYSLSPLFDVLPHGSRASYPKEHAIAVGEEGRIGTAQNLLSRCNAFGLTEFQAKEIIKNVRDVLESRDEFFKDAEMSDYQMRQLDHYYNLGN
ncbi:type II toxin-antitoxin system HipA family toxin [Acinetobacter sp. YH01020]|uniref:type II toxin-antitoxin system HipA family toxin n=1 Tax=Acinetobacter sp. YH01020 TaxID=2601034 RepID=UPI00211F0E27|nr:HipA domain-containing protein [Acinetobacter sp. YH01020]